MSTTNNAALTHNELAKKETNRKLDIRFHRASVIDNLFPDRIKLGYSAKQLTKEQCLQTTIPWYGTHLPTRILDTLANEE